MTHKTVKSSLKELSFYGANILNCYGQFNNLQSDELPTNKYLENRSSIHDLDLFILNVQADKNPDFNPIKHCIYFQLTVFSIYTLSDLGNSSNLIG